MARRGGAFQAISATLLRMLHFAFGQANYRIVGVPNWFREHLYVRFSARR
jgi:hypothetical protein